MLQSPLESTEAGTRRDITGYPARRGTEHLGDQSGPLRPVSCSSSSPHFPISFGEQFWDLDFHTII